MQGFNWLLILVTVIVAVLAVLTALYILVQYQHPEDKNQAWFPKGVVVFGITLSIWTLLLFPLDTANRKACSSDVPSSYCTFTLPTEQLWLAVFIINAILVFAIIPFALFYYEADSELTTGQRVVSGLVWGLGTAVTFALILGICYLLVGYVEYPVIGLESGLAPAADLSPVLAASANLTAHSNTTNTFAACPEAGTGPTGVVYAGSLCDAINGNITVTTWKVRCSFPVYLIAMAATAGWLLFMVFAGVGLVALPLDLISEFSGRPKAAITHSEYIKRARGLGARAKTMKDVVDALRKDQRQGAKGQSWRGAYRRIQEQLLDLEKDSVALELVFPQGEDSDYVWAVTVMSFWFKMAMGVVSAVLSVAWMVQIILYMFANPPISPFLNSLFITLDNAFPLFGTAAFAICCFYLIGVTIKGCTKVGLHLLVYTVHPMRPGATMMSSMLFNTALVLLATNAVIQFCAQAFALYSVETAIQSIWGDQILHLMGIKYLYQLNVFLYCMFIFIGATIVVLLIRGPAKWRRMSKEERFAAAYA